MRVCVLGVVLAVYWGIGCQAVLVWQSDLTLWAHAYRVSPSHNRAVSNYSKALFAVGRDAEARQIAEASR